MAGFNGRISFEGDPARGKQLLGVGLKFAEKQRVSKELLGLASSIKSYDLGGGAFCVVIDMEHMRALHIVAPEFAESEYAYEEEPVVSAGGVGVYDVIAGYTHDPTIVQTEITDKAGKKRKVDVLKHFFPTNRSLARYKDLTIRQRLAVDENPTFTPPGGPEDIRYSEHAHVKPSNYSGAMAQVVQLLLGIGKVLRPTSEEVKGFKPLQPIGTDIFTHKSRVLKSGFGLYGHETAYTPRVDFDYRFSKTHGITFDLDGIPWVIEIGFRGVHAMKLYMDPVSTTREGMRRWVEVSPELEDFIFLFGGIPLGLTIPTFDLFDKLKRAGEVVELISQDGMAEFYANQAMSTDTGWAFSEFGYEAHNTCWSFGADSVKEGFHYTVGTKLQYERFADWTPERSALASKFTTFWEVNKARRMTELQASGVNAVYYELGKDAGDETFDREVVKPTLVGNASLALQRKGKLYNPAKFNFQPQIKFPETLMGGVISFDFSPGDPLLRPKVKCDTPMYVCYIDGELDVICYAFDNRVDTSKPASDTTTQGECQWEGKWTRTVFYGGSVKMNGHFYSNRWDFRHEEFDGLSDVYEEEGNKVAVWPGWSQNGPLSTQVLAYTTVAIFIDTVRHTELPPLETDISIAIPWHDRGAYYLAKVDTQGPHSTTSFGNVRTFGTDQIDEWQLYDGIIYRLDQPTCAGWIDPTPAECVAHKRCLWPQDSCFSDNLHQDFNLMQCPNGVVEVPPWPHPTLPHAYLGPTVQDDGIANSQVYFINDTPYGETITRDLKETFTHGSSLSVWWFQASPQDDGAVAIIEAVHSCLGLHTTNMMQEFGGTLLHLGEPGYMYDIWNACYTGVIE